MDPDKLGRERLRWSANPHFITAMREIAAGAETSRDISRATGMTIAQSWRAAKVLERHGRIERKGTVKIPVGQPLIRWRSKGHERHD